MPLNFITEEFVHEATKSNTERLNFMKNVATKFIEETLLPHIISCCPNFTKGGTGYSKTLTSPEFPDKNFLMYCSNEYYDIYSVCALSGSLADGPSSGFRVEVSDDTAYEAEKNRYRITITYALIKGGIIVKSATGTRLFKSGVCFWGSMDSTNTSKWIGNSSSIHIPSINPKGGSVQGYSPHLIDSVLDAQDKCVLSNWYYGLTPIKNCWKIDFKLGVTTNNIVLENGVELYKIYSDNGLVAWVEV